MGIEATPKDYWIAPNAINITLNALGEANRIQGNASPGAVISCYMSDIAPGGKNGDGLQLDNGRNPKRWPLVVSPTFFSTDTIKYVYAAIPRTADIGTLAVIVFPSEKLDIYGVNASDAQVGSEDYFYIFLQAIITAPSGEPLEREWSHEIEWGSLGTYEDIIDLSKNADWYKYDILTGLVTFLKDIIMNPDSSFRNINLDGKTLTSVADRTTPVDSESAVVTPSYCLSKLSPDTARGLITFLQGIAFGNGATGIDGNGNATLRDVLLTALQTPGYTGTDIVGDKGARLWEEDGLSHLIVDNLTVRLKAYFAQLEIRRVTFTGGDLFFSSAGSKIIRVMPVDVNGNVLLPTREVLHLFDNGNGEFMSLTGKWYGIRTTDEYTSEELALLTRAYRCYEMSDDGTTATTNTWEPGDMARCQTFNIDDGVHENVSNRYYGRIVLRKGREMLEDGLLYNYVDLSVSESAEIGGAAVVGVDNRTGITNDIPQAGDHIAQVGSQTDPDRQALIELALHDGGSINLYTGVDDWNLASHEVLTMGPNGFIINSQYFKFTTASGIEQTVEEYLAGAKIETDSTSASAIAKPDGTITTITDVSGLPTTIGLTDGGSTIPTSQWKTVAVNGTTVYVSEGQPIPGLLTQLIPSRAGMTTDTLSLSWSYREMVHPVTGEVLPLGGGAIPISISYTFGSETRTVTTEIPLIVSRRGESGTGTPVTVTLSPSTILIEERLQTDPVTGELVKDENGKYIKEVDYAGASAAKVIVTQGTGTVTPTSISVNVGQTGITATVSGSEVRVSGVPDNMRQNSITVNVTYGGATYELPLSVYVNRLGTWESQAIGDIMTSISTREMTFVDASGNPITTTQMTRIYQDAARIEQIGNLIRFLDVNGNVYMTLVSDGTKAVVQGDYFEINNINITGQSIFRGFLMREKYTIKAGLKANGGDWLQDEYGNYYLPDFTSLGSWVEIPDGMTAPDGSYPDIAISLPHFPRIAPEENEIWVDDETGYVAIADVTPAQWKTYTDRTISYVGAKLLITNESSLPVYVNTLVGNYNRTDASVEKLLQGFNSLECKAGEYNAFGYTGTVVYWELSLGAVPSKYDAINISNN